METVLVVGATGNIGVSAVKGALNSKRNVLAIVRSQASADKLFRHIGSSDGITIVQADVLSDTGIKGVVDQVKAGNLPAFQHVYSCGLYCLDLKTGLGRGVDLLNHIVGGEYIKLAMKDITTERLRANMNSMFEAAFCKSFIPPQPPK